MERGMLVRYNPRRTERTSKIRARLGSETLISWQVTAHAPMLLGNHQNHTNMFYGQIFSEVCGAAPDAHLRWVGGGGGQARPRRSLDPLQPPPPLIIFGNGAKLESKLKQRIWVSGSLEPSERLTDATQRHEHPQASKHTSSVCFGGGGGGGSGCVFK